MFSYIGNVGSLIPIRCATRPGFKDERPMSTSTTLGGRRVAHMGGAPKRTWNCSIPGALASDASTLQMLTRSLPMPWVWLDAWAQSTNTLTPEHSLWQGLTLAGATIGSIVALEGGGFAPSLNDPVGTPRFMTLYHPVVPGVSVTAGVHARQSSGTAVSLRINWRDAAGNLILPTVSAQKVCAGSGPLTRVTVTATPPANAVDCYLVVSNHSVLAGPSLTFTNSPTPWGTGAGCMTVVVDGLDVSVLQARTDIPGRYAGYSFTVTEVG